MTESQFKTIEAAMLKGMQNSVHDTGHVYRVLYAALRIAKGERKADTDVVILSALLHDIGRAAQSSGQTLEAGHAALGAKMARDILIEAGWDEKTAARVCDCIATHSYKAGHKPQSLEAKILFDADKLDLCGAVGCARAMLFGAEIGEPLYLTGADGLPTKGAKGEDPSLLREYRRKLRHLPGRFLTKKGRALAQKRQQAMDAYFAALRGEVAETYKRGAALLEDSLS